MNFFQRWRDQVNEFFNWLLFSNSSQAAKFRNFFQERLQSLPYWVAACGVGFIAVFYSGLFSKCISAVVWIQQTHPYWLFVTSPIFLFLSYYLVEKYAPEAAGAGVSTVVRALNLDPKGGAVAIDRILSIRVALIIILSSCLGVLGAGSLGREGPIIHLSACIFYFFARMFHRFRPYEEHRSWIMAGGAAGVSAAFNAPLAGVVFVLEELAQQYFHQFKTVVITAAVIGGVVSQWLSGKYLFFGYPATGNILLSSLPAAVGLGVICGVLAYPFHWMLRPSFRNRFQKLFKTRVVYCIFAGFALAFIAVFVSPWSLGGGVSTIEHLLFEPGAQANSQIFLGRFFGVFITHLVGGVGGFLAPSLALGASIGSKVAVLTAYSNPTLLIIVGMSAFLSAIIRAPFTGWVIVMEMTGAHSAVFPLMLASLVSWSTLRALERFKTY